MFFWISCMATGLSLYLLVRVFTRPVVQQKNLAGHGPGRLLLRLAWPWVLALTPVCQPFIPWRMRHIVSQRLQRAGISRQCAPEHIVAMQALCCLVLAVATVFALSVLDASGAIPLMWLAAATGLAGMWWPQHWLRDLGRERQARMLRELPFLLDMTTLCVEAGLNLQGALQQAARHGPEGPLRTEIEHALADMRTGMSRLQALNALADRTGLAVVHSLVAAMGQADQLGMSLGPLLRSQSEQRRAERFLRAEKLALEAPVKMLFPMVFCIFPCTFLIIGFPIVVKLLAADL
ncbi:type II secretion system F family protein [Pusillimonas sp. SM2304]|uniref:type II secretion system F family protein n=1 Tax=Pusillimonas sp. SM2304 TaxID=3073241 RepID=UPI002875E73B|nr:type II secretion system F family protein [Pusillimonas sp. SM2304]MDS1141793.1 type II secretion system F family protein [Pusillimonas sp. SM2304]